jgi:light-regulated signal transduction histidine kinase (bacteriophytochrome)
MALVAERFEVDDIDPFEKFVSGRPDTGTDMGLYIVKEIVESHNGEVLFFANRRHGTKFRLAFPLMERYDGRKSKGYISPIGPPASESTARTQGDI